MNFPTEVFDEVTVVHTSPDFSGTTCDEFSDYIASLDRFNYVFDLDATESLDSHSLATLLDVQDRLHGEFGEAKIATSHPANRKILEITRLDHQFEVFDDVVDAVRSFR